MEKIILQDKGGGIFEIKPEGRESRPRTAYGLDQACLIVGGLAKAGYDVTDAQRRLMQIALEKAEAVYRNTPELVQGA